MKLTLLLAALLCAAPAAADDVFRVYLAGNGVWYDGASPSDYEAGVAARASLSPHISAVGSGYYGFVHEYLRGSAGVRITATDVNNPNFSIGIGIQRHFSNDETIRREEWVPDASIGWRPWAATNPKVVVVAQAGYGLESGEGSALAGLRFQIGGNP